MLPYHFGVALGTLILLSRMSATFFFTALAVTCSAAYYAWRDFSLGGPGSGKELGEDDRMSIYWLLKGVYFGRNDLVCTMQDFEWICAVSDVDVDEERMGEGESEFDIVQDPAGQGPVDCTIRVAGYNAAEPGTEMRIIVQCVE